MMTWPALLKVLLLFVAVLAAGRFKINLGISLLAAGPVLGLWMGLGLDRLPGITLDALTKPITLRLALLVALILGLSRLMKETGRMDGIVDRFSALVRSPKAVAGAMPALIGLLPMPGGALFSAPMVESACRPAEAGGGDPPLMASVNYWFRHHGEYWWPLYPGFILAVSLLNVPSWAFMAATLPLAIVHLAGGVIFLLPRLTDPPPVAQKTQGSIPAFLAEVSPILVVVGAVPLFALLELGFTSAGLGDPFPEGTALVLGLATACLVTARTGGLGLPAVTRLMAKRETLDMLFLVVGIMVFQTFMTASGAVGEVQGELTRYGIPSLAMVAVLPFISGILTGIAFGYVAASFPLVVPLFAGLTGGEYLAYGVLAFVSGFLGMMISPVHMCFLMSRDYFCCRLSQCYRWLIWPLCLNALALAVCVWVLTLF